MPPYCWWRELIMWVGFGLLLLCGLLVGRDYFNRVCHEVFDGSPD